MKLTYLVWFSSRVLVSLPIALRAQAVPTTPTEFDRKPVGAATSSTGATINPPAGKTTTETRQITYLTLSPLRQWTSADGKVLMGKLIAWEEEIVVTKAATKAVAAPAPPTAPITTRPTIIKDHKVRLLIGTKAFELPLNRLGSEEQQFIQNLSAAVKSKP